MKKVKQGQTRWFGGSDDEGNYVVVPAFVERVRGDRVFYRAAGKRFVDQERSFLFWYRPTYRQACRARDLLVEMDRAAMRLMC
jgi:hypothetical protein